MGVQKIVYSADIMIIGEQAQRQKIAIKYRTRDTGIWMNVERWNILMNKIYLDNIKIIDDTSQVTEGITLARKKRKRWRMETVEVEILKL